jgi:hypothetical protein
MTRKLESTVVHYHFSSKEAVDALLIYLHDYQHTNVSIPKGSGVALSVAPDGGSLVISIISNVDGSSVDESDVTCRIVN